MMTMRKKQKGRAVQNGTKEFAALLNTDEFEMVEEQLKDENYQKSLVI